MGRRNLGNWIVLPRSLDILMFKRGLHSERTLKGFPRLEGDVHGYAQVKRELHLVRSGGEVIYDLALILSARGLFSVKAGESDILI